MIEKSKYCSDVITKHFNKELVMTNEDNEYSKHSVEGWICNNDYVVTDVKVRDLCHINGKYRDSHIEIITSILN